MLAILKYKAGNQTSVRRALDSLGIENTITADPAELEQAQGVIFPGVGAAGTAMDELVGEGLDAVLKSLIWQEKPLLGICVGCQILLDYSEENDTKALSVIPGECRLFNPSWTEDAEGRIPIKVPHMGWNSVQLRVDCELFRGIDPRSEFYFVHSYFPAPAEEYVIGQTVYGRPFCSVHGRRGLWAVQFHPEKSGRPGLQLLSNFADYCREAADAQ
ncbi:MAG TPA: imidazole glycerol phosphate synthase subunit HisH [Desulfovibrio sp.]|jgi:glutamine amidotransferase|uniref:imidazole glycerol phosphate synthase subunit HisH n=1 Tax=Desulfovibrio TaxID=872 RepID=UPI002A433622|nr:imidazole glycerol phosphate synthase subunit HisH [Desulfovibrio sp.]MDY0306230.1 imidazole glycerol phosphate synthase subunit HisH [Desulfovibrionaceae bacterium]HMM37383.1 imidazole glycerol phosphate synthase subunit HisH [Desulfovibrio sp.]